MKYLIFLSLFSTPLYSQEKILSGYDPKTDVISDNYEAGSWLIYDCQERHWTCVLESYYRECEEKRKKDFQSPNEVYHSCAPVGEFLTKLSCFQRQLFMVSQNFGQRFCIKDNWKKKNIEY